MPLVFKLREYLNAVESKTACEPKRLHGGAYVDIKFCNGFKSMGE